MIRQRKRFLSLLGAILLLGMIGTSLASFVVSRASMRAELADDTLPLVGETVYSEARRDLLRPVFVSSQMAGNTFVHDWVHSGETEPERMGRYLATIRDASGAFTAFFVSERTRRYYSADGVLKSVAPDEPRDAWFFRVRALTEPFEINVDPDMANDDELAVFVNYRVLDAAGTFLGAIGVGLSIDTLNRLIESYGETYDRLVYFADRDGVIRLGAPTDATARDLGSIEGMEDVAREILASEDERSLSYERDGARVFVNSRFMDALGWYLVVEQRESSMLGAITRTLSMNLAASVAIALVALAIVNRALARYQGDLERAATRDRLTGLHNRAAFEEVVNAAFAREAGRTGGPSLLFVDIDHFKAINDRHGHLAGDAAIRHCARTLSRALRPEDTACRWGGEEFCVLLGGRLGAEAIEAAEHVRLAIEASALGHEGVAIDMTVSIGAGERLTGETLDAFLQRVDRALYAAKANGRNRVQAADAGPAGADALPRAA